MGYRPLWRFLKLCDYFEEILKIKVLRKLRNVFKCLTFALQKKVTSKNTVHPALVTFQLAWTTESTRKWRHIFL